MASHSRFQPKDLLVNKPPSTAVLNANDGRVGALARDKSYFVTCLLDLESLPAPAEGTVQVCADGHFGGHDPTRAPQFYDSHIPHFAVFPRFPTLESDPYFLHRHMWSVPGEEDIDWHVGSVSGVGLLKRAFFVRCRAAVFWADQRAQGYYTSQQESDRPNKMMIHFLDMRVPRLKQFLARLESVVNSLTGIRIMMNGLFRLWLDVSAGIDYITIYQPVIRHDRRYVDFSPLPLTLGVFTSDHNVVEMFSHTPNVPVFYIRELAAFNTQRILKVVALESTAAYTPPPTSYPTIFSGSSDDPAKLGSQVRFLDRILRFRSSAVGFMPLPSTITGNTEASSSSVGPQRSTSSLKSTREKSASLQKKIKPADPNARNIFADDTREPFAPPLHPGWSGINLEVIAESVEEKRRIQRQQKEQLLTAKYVLPPPGLLLLNWSICGRHSYIVLLLCNPWLSSQEWKDILYLPNVPQAEEGQSSTRRAQQLAKTAASLGEALSSPDISFSPVCPVPPDGFIMPSHDEGRELMWSLFEIAFRFEFCILDDAVRDHNVMLAQVGADAESVTEDEECAAYEARYSQLFELFPEGSLTQVDPNRVSDGLCSDDWAPRAERLEKMRRFIGMWPRVAKPAILKVPISPMESDQGLKQERALALLYAQTFYDTFERPAILPRAWFD